MTNTLFRGSYLNRCVEAGRLGVKWIIFFLLCRGDVPRYMRMRREVLFFLCRAGLYDPRELAFVKRLLKPGDVAVDVGANFGVYAQTMAEAVGAGGKVVAFEALHANYEALKSLSAKYPQLECREVGISNGKAASAEFHLPLLFGRIPEPALASIEKSYLPAATFQVALTSLDQVSVQFDRLRFIKVDIEGHEPEFFEGAVETLKRFRPIVQFEENDPKSRFDWYTNYAKALGYSLCFLGDGGELKTLTAATQARGFNFYLVPSDTSL